MVGGGVLGAPREVKIHHLTPKVVTGGRVKLRLLKIVLRFTSSSNNSMIFDNTIIDNEMQYLHPQRMTRKTMDKQLFLFLEFGSEENPFLQKYKLMEYLYFKETKKIFCTYMCNQFFCILQTRVQGN